MSDVPAYVIANFTINDKDEYRKYEKGFFPILKKHGGSFFTFDDNTKHLEGSDPRPFPRKPQPTPGTTTRNTRPCQNTAGPVQASCH